LRQFYISDPKIFDLKMSAFDFKLYSYLCKNYDLKRLTPYVRMIDCAGPHDRSIAKNKRSSATPGAVKYRLQTAHHT